MVRNIYRVDAMIVDSNGTFNTLSGYPKAFDSKNYSGDIEKAKDRAYAEYHEVLGAMFKRDDRQIQIAMIIDVNSGIQLEMTKIGNFAEPEPEEDE